MSPATISQCHSLSKGKVILDMRAKVFGFLSHGLAKGYAKTLGPQNIKTAIHITQIKIRRAALLNLWAKHIETVTKRFTNTLLDRCATKIFTEANAQFFQLCGW